MKKAIIVGATSGIGKGLARILAENGYIVGITGRRLELLTELKSENPEHYFIKCFDIRETRSVSTNLEDLTYELAGLDLLIICSGIGNLNHCIDFEDEFNTIKTNVCGFTALIDWAFNYFENQNHGHLIAISSVAGLRGNRFALTYSATKAFQMNYLEGLRQKAHKEKMKIIITDIRPGFVDTSMTKEYPIFMKTSLEKACRQIYHRAILKKRTVIYVSRSWRLIAILFKAIPRWIYDRA